MQQQCKQCGGLDFVMQLREVTVRVAWAHSAMSSVAPCSMCTKCGDHTVVTEVKIGKFVDLVPGAQAPTPPAARAPAGPPVQLVAVPAPEAQVEAPTPLRSVPEPG